MVKIYIKYIHLPLCLLGVVPGAEPRDCTNVTFLSRGVTLMWTPISAVKYNGRALGYNLTCSSDSSHVDKASSLNSNITIAGLVPFSSYTCNLSAVNEIGKGPLSQCFFTTAQDSGCCWIKLLSLFKKNKLCLHFAYSCFVLSFQFLQVLHGV